ncbi:hypothetical protein F4777DRAFT_535380 [Nemania sp. FL0916]|nr:hypothetical protein F4777DRAFT_535380 [Nemania sp. FL0916]
MSERSNIVAGSVGLFMPVLHGTRQLLISMSKAILQFPIYQASVTPASRTLISENEIAIAESVTRTTQRLTQITDERADLHGEVSDSTHDRDTASVHTEEGSAQSAKSPTITFGGNNSGFQLGTNSGTISGVSFGVRGN